MTRARDLSNLIGSGNYTSTTFTATAGQTVFTIAHTQGFIQVFMNGLLLDETTDYTSNGTAVTLTQAATAGDELEVVKYNTFSVGDAITQTDADTRYVNASGHMTGNLGIGTISAEHMLHLKSTGPASIKIEADSDNSNEADHAHMEFSQDGDRVKTLIGFSDAENAFKIRAGEISGNADSEIKMYTGWNLSDPASVGNEALTINSVGQTRLPKQPRAWMAKGSADGQNLTGADTHKISFSQYTATNGMSFSNTNDRITIPSTGSGNYLIQVMIAGSIITANPGDGIYLDIRKNGSSIFSTYAQSLFGTGNVTGEEWTASDGYVVPLSGSDYIEVFVHNVSTSTTNFSVSRGRLSIYAVG